MDWKGYAACCHQNAGDPEARLCPECGHVLLRCAGFAECSMLVDPTEFCVAHIAPRLYLEAGATNGIQVGQRATLPLVLVNESKLPGALRIDKIQRALPGSALEEVELFWNELRAGEERAFGLDTGVLDASGASRLDVVVITSRVLDGHEERHAFAAELILKVGERVSDKHITQHIHVTGGHFEPGASAIVQTGPAIHADSGFATSPGAIERRTLVAEFRRAEALELRLGIRGVLEANGFISREVEVRCVGFADDEIPTSPRPFLERRVLHCGRNSRRGSERNPEPNDLVLRARDAATGEIDRERSLRVSGRQFDLVLSNGRLNVRALGSGTTQVNDEALPRDAERVLLDGDRIGVAESDASGIGITVSMRTQRQRIETITLRKSADTATRSAIR